MTVVERVDRSAGVWTVLRAAHTCTRQLARWNVDEFAIAPLALSHHAVTPCASSMSHPSVPARLLQALLHIHNSIPKLIASPSVGSAGPDAQRRASVAISTLVPRRWGTTNASSHPTTPRLDTRHERQHLR